MDKLLNPGSGGFIEALASKIYVDKTGLLAHTNSLCGTKQKWICFSRPRRFGKTMAAEMLCAYYSKGCDSRALFENLRIGQDPSFERHLNKYNVIFLNMQSFLSQTHEARSLVERVSNDIEDALRKAFGDELPKGNVVNALIESQTKSGTPFVFVIDEWDCVFREQKNDTGGHKVYLDFLRLLLKDQEYVQLAYMTGILPIKKYGTHSALNMFTEHSMASPLLLAEFVGFTEPEARALCDSFDMSFEEAREWYDGYSFKNEKHVYNPLSMVSAMINKEFNNYWNVTETLDALRIYIDMNFDGLKDAIVDMLGQGSRRVSIARFQNDMSTFTSADDVLTLLVHLGYLRYDSASQEVSIPNKEIREEFKNAVEGSGWPGVAEALTESRSLLAATWAKNESFIAEAIGRVHNNSASILKYNDENSLACTVLLAYYSAADFYFTFRELASGKGFIDILFLPKPRHLGKSALLIELKWDKSAVGAISQIKDKNYPEKVSEYTGNILMIGVNYDTKSKKHDCVIEELAL
jgi:hypothetical protein